MKGKPARFAFLWSLFVFLFFIYIYIFFDILLLAFRFFFERFFCGAQQT